ncbi:MAG: hypothetical protein A4C66_03195 [Nitrospira sp. HN-bin3]|uniref:hypothetical protein n=1 Tax=Nitrospira cf. moscoviensis SBR1015 TaxID=96242 RepID=UPI000A0ED100|nr:hypothetical protein [Nitrospira cf. moscoviensis SBR1015]OQW37052.1 MAG: hypothetical protein A4C66_03195 [Nitrospira sp. HN-bin3]
MSAKRERNVLVALVNGPMGGRVIEAPSGARIVDVPGGDFGEKMHQYRIVRQDNEIVEAFYEETRKW